jgi:hypothetical protein
MACSCRPLEAGEEWELVSTGELTPTDLERIRSASVERHRGTAGPEALGKSILDHERTGSVPENPITLAAVAVAAEVTDADQPLRRYTPGDVMNRGEPACPQPPPTSP